MQAKCGFSLVMILVSILGSLGITGVNQSNIENYVAKDCVSVADFVEDNFVKFVDEYNACSAQNWDASYVENRFPITIDECGTVYDGVFLDFDEDNGYAVIGNDYMLLDFAITGISPYKNIKSDSFYFSVSSGYFYLSDNEYLSVNEENNADDSFFNKNIATKHYDGQESGETGCGKIEYTDKYVKSRYGSGWTLSSSKSLLMQGYDQYNLSCYNENSIVNNEIKKSSEGNCWVVSAYNVLQYLADTKWTSMPKSSSKVTYDPSVSEPNIYSHYFDGKGNNKSKKIYYNNNSKFVYQYTLRQKKMSFPELYTEVRKHVNSKYKDIDGGTIYNTSEIIEYISKKYNYKANAKEHVFWGIYAGNEGIKKLNNGIPLLWSTSNCTYGMHTMAVCGYKWYKKQTGWWIFKSTQYKLFYELRDGHENEPRFYDMCGHWGFGAIISLENI